ncbi:MAG: hypothetical protein ACQEVA_16280, partial [Myxococcota bacterium]
MVFAKRLLFGLVAASLLLGSSSVLAQEEGETEIVKEDDVKKEEDGEREDGFDGRLSTSATFNLVSNSNVVGQNDGNSVMLGGNILGGLDFTEGKHKVSNTLTYNTSWARTPVIAEFVKNNDEIQLENIYNYFLTDWIGPYARLSFETSLFPTERVTGDQKNYEITRLDGGVDTEVTNRLRLADPVNPFELFQSAGIFLEPVRRQAIQAMLRVGFGARETLANGVLIVQDDPNSANIQVQELDDVIQAGAEAFLGAQGKFPEQRIDYRLGATAMIPFINNSDTDASAVDLTRLGFNGALTFNALDWLGLSYDVNVLSDPQMLDKVQVQNSVLLTFNYTFLEADDIKKPEPSEEEEEAPAPTEELEKTKKELEEAEQRAAEAEERAGELEEQLENAQQDVETSRQQLEEAEEATEEAEDATEDAEETTEETTE